VISGIDTPVMNRHWAAFHCTSEVANKNGPEDLAPLLKSRSDAAFAATNSLIKGIWPQNFYEVGGL
jgi:hypothetical protein